MGDTYGARDLVDVLAAGAASVIDVDAEVFLIYIDLDFVCLGRTATVAVLVWMRP